MMQANSSVRDVRIYSFVMTVGLDDYGKNHNHDYFD